MQGLKVTKFIPVDRDQIFAYWVQPELLESWSYPDGMTLRVPLFEAHATGRYRFEHQNANGVYVCTGHIEEIIPNEKIVQMDDEVRGPNGKVLYQNLISITEFKDKDDGTEIIVSQQGFIDRDSMEECRQGWRQSLERLSHVVAFGPEHQIKNEPYRSQSF